MSRETTLLTFEDIRDKVETSYPNPIATAFARYCDSSSRDLTERHKLLLDLFELLVKFLCAVQLTEGRESVPNFAQALTLRSQTLDFLKNPLLGYWMRLLRELCELDLKGAKPEWSQKIAQWYLQQRSSSSDIAVEQFRQRFNLSEKSTGPPIAVICNSLIGSRNEFVHLPTGTIEEREEELRILESVFTFVFGSATFLSEVQLFAAKPATQTDYGMYKFNARILRGTTDRERELIYPDLLQPNWVYLTDSIDRELGSSLLRLTPFFLWQHGTEKVRGQMFVLHKIDRKKLLYASYVTREPHEENSPRLSNLLADLTSLESQTEFDESQYRHLPRDVRSDIARTQYAQALRLIDFKYFEQALKFLEDAASAEKRPEILLSMAEVMIELRESSEEIRSILQECLDLDPTNSQANLLLKSLVESDPYETKPKSTALSDSPLQKTVFHLFCPARLKVHAITFWSVVLVGWYSISAIAEFVTRNPQRAVATTLAMLCCLAVVFGAALLRPWAERLRNPLQWQLDQMREQRFHAWFDKQLAMIFESFSVQDRTPRASRNRRILYALGILWMVSMVGGSMYFSQAYVAQSLLMFKRFVDYFVLFAVLYPAVQYTIAITLFVYHFSNLALKPTLTKMSNDGVRHLGPFVAFNIVFGTLIYSLLHLSFAIGFTNPFRVDLLFLFVGTGITAVWTVAFPFQLRRSLQASKNFAILKYSRHVEEAFDKFVEDPSETNEKAYKRLLENEKIIEKISVWPLSPAETVFVIGGCNLLLCLVASSYVINRLGLWGSILHRF